jgi:hypothetical protein
MENSDNEDDATALVLLQPAVHQKKYSFSSYLMPTAETTFLRTMTVNPVASDHQ